MLILSTAISDYSLNWAAMSRFVLLHHETPPEFGRPTHYDLMLEAGESLWTWELLTLPQPGVEQTCRRLADHRLAYLDYEGPVSGNRGVVRRVDAGEVTLLEHRNGYLRGTISGGIFRGSFVLELASRQPGEQDAWQLVWITVDQPS
jgi:hypothetical protein